MCVSLRVVGTICFLPLSTYTGYSYWCAWWFFIAILLFILHLWKTSGSNMLRLPSERGFCGSCSHAGNRADLSPFPLLQWCLALWGHPCLQCLPSGPPHTSQPWDRFWCSAPHTAQALWDVFLWGIKTSVIVLEMKECCFSTFHTEFRQKKTFYSINHSKI